MITLSAEIYISSNLTIRINSDNIISLNTSTFDREKINLPSWGIVSNRGEISFYDTDSQVLSLIESDQLSKSAKVKIFLSNTLVGNSKTLGEFFTDQWKYDNNSRLVTVSIKDDLEEWQEVVISQPYQLNNFTYLDLYYQLVSQTPSKFIITANDDILNYLSSIKENNSSNLVGNTLWTRWQQFCEGTMLHIYKNNKGEVVVSNHI